MPHQDKEPQRAQPEPPHDNAPPPPEQLSDLPSKTLPPEQQAAVRGGTNIDAGIKRAVDL